MTDQPSGVTLGDYVDWICQTGGYCQKGIAADHERGMVPVTKIVAANGRWVIHPGADHLETLSPSVIEYYDRRLQVLSPFKYTPRS